MALPEGLVKLGIYQITLRFYDYPELEFYIHQEGLLFTDMPDSFLYIISIGYTVVVSHEVIQMQKYNEEQCVINPDYKLDKCRFDYIKKVKNRIIRLLALLLLILMDIHIQLLDISKMHSNKMEMEDKQKQ